MGPSREAKRAVQPELHPLNHAFAWEPRRGPFQRLAPEQVRDYDELGFFVVEDAFDADLIRRVIAEVEPWERRATEFLRTRDGGKLFIAQADEITFTTHLVARSAFLREFAAASLFQGLCHDLIGPNVRLYWDQAVYKKPEPQRQFPWHQDNSYNFVEPQSYVTCWVALTDATEETGCPWVVPGAHRLGTLRHGLTEFGWQCFEHPEGAVPVPVRAGSLAVFSSLTPHKTGPNRSGAVRKAYILQYAPDGARVIHEDPATGERHEIRQDAVGRQFEILRAGRPVAR
jgi:ectoine hydroxylase-related dioxygenase (phytanoyl-CoA dioxygenase family)